MKLTFDDRSYVECKKSDTPGKILLIISAADHMEPGKKTTNAVEITIDEFNQLIGDVL
jgi:hypothetical protein